MRSFEAYSLRPNGRYRRIEKLSGAVHSVVLPGLDFRPDWVWPLHPPNVLPRIAAMSAERARLLSTPPPPASDKPVA